MFYINYLSKCSILYVRFSVVKESVYIIFHYSCIKITIIMGA